MIIIRVHSNAHSVMGLNNHIIESINTLHAHKDRPIHNDKSDKVGQYIYSTMKLNAETVSQEYNHIFSIQHSPLSDSELDPNEEGQRLPKNKHPFPRMKTEANYYPAKASNHSSSVATRRRLGKDLSESGTGERMR